MHERDSLATVLKVCKKVCKKETPTQVFFWEYPKSFRDICFRTILVTAFELSFSIRKELKKKEISGEIAFALINLCQVQKTRAYKQVNYHKSICCSCEIFRISLSQNIWNKKLMMTLTFPWMNIASLALL